MKKKKKVKVTKRDPLKQIAKIIESNGWKVLVIGSARIQQPLFANQYNYEFVVSFTGAKKQAQS